MNKQTNMNRSIMVTHLTQNFTNDEELKKYFSRFYGDHVLHAVMVPR